MVAACRRKLADAAADAGSTAAAVEAAAGGGLLADRSTAGLAGGSGSGQATEAIDWEHPTGRLLGGVIEGCVWSLLALQRGCSSSAPWSTLAGALDTALQVGGRVGGWVVRPPWAMGVGQQLADGSPAMPAGRFRGMCGSSWRAAGGRQAGEHVGAVKPCWRACCVPASPGMVGSRLLAPRLPACLTRMPATQLRLPCNCHHSCRYC